MQQKEDQMATIIKGDGTPVTAAGLHRGAPWLTDRQIRSMSELPDDHIVDLGARSPLVREPSGGLLRLRPSGALVAARPVESIQSYLDVNG
jgi:hypothetical protein